MLKDISLVLSTVLYYLSFINCLDIFIKRNKLFIQGLCFYSVIVFGLLYSDIINVYLSLVFFLVVSTITACMLYTDNIKTTIVINIIVFIMLAGVNQLLRFDIEIFKSFTVFIVSYMAKQFFHIKVLSINADQAVAILFPLICLFIIVGLDEISFIIIVLLIASCMCILFLFNQLSKMNEIKNDCSNISKDLEIKNNDLSYIKELYSAQRKQAHDYKNKLVTLKALIYEDNLDKAKEYTDIILDSVLYNSKIISTNNDIIDALLNSKYYLCHSKNITMQFKIDDLSNAVISNDDLIVILSNALDNAIEAAVKCDNPVIKLKIENKEVFVLSVINTSQKVIIKDNSIIKNHSLNHGYGLSIIKSITDKYNGTLALNYKDNLFQLSIIL